MKVRCRVITHLEHASRLTLMLLLLGSGLLACSADREAAPEPDTAAQERSEPAQQELAEPVVEGEGEEAAEEMEMELEVPPEAADDPAVIEAKKQKPTKSLI